MPHITTYEEASLTAREVIRLAHADACVYAVNYGVVADGTTDDTAALQAAADAAFGPYSAPKPREQYRTLILPQGIIKITSPIALSRGLAGGKIIGAGRTATIVSQRTVGASCFVTNGAQYNYFAHFWLETDQGVCFDLNYDGSGTNSCALQSNTFFDMFFYAKSNTATNAIGVRIANGGFMGSENLFIACFWQTCRYGIVTQAFNALQNTVLGGNMQNCGWGIYIGSGSVTLIESVGFQLSVNYDIEAYASAFDTMVVNSCRTESPNFIKPGLQGAIVTGCTQYTPSTPGYFCYSIWHLTKLVGCQVVGPGGYGSAGGRIFMARGGTIDTCYFGAPDGDILDNSDNPRPVRFQNLNFETFAFPSGWMVGKYIHNDQIPPGSIKLNYNDRETNAQIYGDDLCVMRAAGSGASCVRATTSKSSGKWYWEVYIHYYSTTDEGPGVANAAHTLTNALGVDTNGISLRYDGLYYNNTLVVSMPPYTTGATVRFSLDKDNNKLWACADEEDWNNSGTDNPATNTGGYTIAVTGALYPTMFTAIEKGSQVGIFQSRRWKYTAPSGFSELT